MKKRGPKQLTLTIHSLPMISDSEEENVSIEQASHASSAYRATRTAATMSKVCGKKGEIKRK